MLCEMPILVFDQFGKKAGQGWGKEGRGRGGRGEKGGEKGEESSYVSCAKLAQRDHQS